MATNVWEIDKEKVRRFQEETGLVKRFKFDDSIPAFSWTEALQKAARPVLEARARMEPVDKPVVVCNKAGTNFRLVYGDECILCKKRITGIMLKEHVKRVHLDAKQCKTCGIYVENGKKGLAEHHRNEHRQVYRCTCCQFACLTHESFQWHKAQSRSHTICLNAEIRAYNKLIDEFKLSFEKVPETDLPYEHSSIKEMRRVRRLKEEVDEDVVEMAKELERLVSAEEELEKMDDE